VRTSGREPKRLLPFRSRCETCRARHGSAGCDTTNRARDAKLWAATNHRRVATPRLDGDPKRVHRILREDNLLCLRRRKFLTTTDSRHGFSIYPNLAGKLQLTDVNQLWIADITYIRLEIEFVYLAVVLDAFSRRVIGWALDRTMEAKLTIAALKMALSRRSVKAGLVHHSDRGVQYAADDYTSLLAQHDIQHEPQRKSLRQCPNAVAFVASMRINASKGASATSLSIHWACRLPLGGLGPLFPDIRTSSQMLDMKAVSWLVSPA
jgi:transposase InsO family protein